MKGRILLVDDEEIVLRSCQRILGKNDYEIDVANNGLAALGMVNENEYDVLILDIKMPKMDGIEVLRRVKEARPDIDIIMITGLHDIETAVAEEDRARFCVPEKVVQELADNVPTYEQVAGGPADVEWAWDGEQLWWVQCRPITSFR